MDQPHKMTTPNNYPAFPRPRTMHKKFDFRPDSGIFDDPPQEGMSLRDWFAGMAMNGCINSILKSGIPGSNEGAAKYCYAFADAMMKERDK